MTGQIEFLRKFNRQADESDSRTGVVHLMAFRTYAQMQHWIAQARELYPHNTFLMTSNIMRRGDSKLLFRVVDRYEDAIRFAAGVRLDDAYIGAGVSYPAQQFIRSRVCG